MEPVIINIEVGESIINAAWIIFSALVIHTMFGSTRHIYIHKNGKEGA